METSYFIRFTFSLIIRVQIVVFIFSLYACEPTEQKTRVIKETSQEDSLLLRQKPLILEISDNGLLDSANHLFNQIPYEKLKSSKAKGNYHYLKGYLLDYKGDYRESIYAYQEAIKLLKDLDGGRSLDLAHAHNDLAYVYAEANLEAERINHYKIAYDIIWNHHKDKPDEIASIVNNYLGALSDYGSGTGEVAKKAMWYFEDSLAKDSGFQSKPEDEKLEILSLYYLGLVRASNVFFDESILSYALDKQHKLFLNSSDSQYISRLLYAYDNAGYAYMKVKKMDEAKRVFEQMSSLVKSKKDKVKAASNFAALYFQTEEFKKAEESYSEIIRSQSWKPKDINFLVLSAAEAWMMSKQGKLKDAQESINKMWQVYSGKESFHLLTDIEAILGSNSTRLLLGLTVTAEIYRLNFQEFGLKEDYQIAEKMAVCAAKMFQNYYTKEAYNEKLTDINENIREELLTLMTLSPDPPNPELINLLENNTSQHLWKNFLAKNLKQMQVDEVLLKKQNELLIRKAQSPEDPSINHALKQVNQQIDRQLSKDFSRQLDIRKIQTSLKPAHAIVRFLYGEKTLFAFVLKKDKLELYALGKTKEIDQLCQQYYQLLTHIDPNYNTLGRKLYQMLLGKLNLENCHTLTIIPEKGLLNIPFETLETDNGEELGRKMPISYNFSLQFASKKPVSFTRILGKDLVAYAPEYARYEDLKSSQLEVKKITTVFGGDKYAGRYATKEAFISNVGKYPVQHLAMHAIIDTTEYEASALLFGDSVKLSFGEIYPLTIPAELVTLSACNTGIGRYHFGEGYMSLARALTFAGTHAVAHSLWAVPDEETAEIMAYFYENLKAGMSKEKALFESKRTFLKQNPLKQHPYFWAGFILNGNTEPLRQSNFWIYLIACLLIAGFIFIYKASKIR